MTVTLLLIYAITCSVNLMLKSWLAIKKPACASRRAVALPT